MSDTKKGTKKTKRQIYDHVMKALDGGKKKEISPSELAAMFWAEDVAPSKCAWFLRKLGFKVEVTKEGRSVIRYTIVELPKAPPVEAERKRKATKEKKAAAPKKEKAAKKAVAPKVKPAAAPKAAKVKPTTKPTAITADADEQEDVEDLDSGQGPTTDDNRPSFMQAARSRKSDDD